MRRLLTRLLFVGLFAVVAAGFGTALALLATGTGRSLLARIVSDQSNRLVRGSVYIARIGGDFRTHLALDSVIVRDTAGGLLASVPRLEVRFGLAGLLAGSYVFTSVRAVEPEIRIVKHRGGRMNFQEVLRLGERSGGGSSPLFEIRHLEVVDGRLEIRTPWNPDGRLTTPAQRDSALQAQRARPGRRIEESGRPHQGLEQVRVVDELRLAMPVITLASPEGKPLTARIDSLAARVSDPGIRIRDLSGAFTQGADSLVFEFDRVALPATVARGAGRIDWPRDTILYDFAMTAPQLALVDLRWVSPDFPALEGRGAVNARSIAGSRTEYAIRDLALAGDGSRVAGRLVAILDVYRGLGFRDLDVDLVDFDLDAVRPYLDTLPLEGRLTGPLRATGFFDAMSASFDWTFQDARVEGGAQSRVALSGALRLGGGEGITFLDARLEQSDLDLRTVRLLAAAVALDGRLELAGTLDGPWRNVVFTGDARHRDGDRPASQVRGTARLDTRGDVLALDADVVLDTLWFDGIRGSFPSLTLQGGLAGPVRLNGDLERLGMVARVGGRAGQFDASGTLTLRPPRLAADSLVVSFTNADLGAVAPRAPVSRLTGRLWLTGGVDTLVAPEGRLRVELVESRLREAPLDSARIRVAVRDSVIVLDSARVWWEGGEARAGGALGWAEPHRGRIEGDVVALALGAFDSLAIALSGRSREDLAEGELLAGRARAQFTLDGSLDGWELDLAGRADSVRWLEYATRGATATLQWWGGRQQPARFDARAAIDSAEVGRYVVQGIDGRAAGTPDRFTWRVGGAAPANARVRAAGFSAADAPGRVLGVDSLDLTVLARTWRLREPVRVELSEARLGFDPVVVETGDGSSRIRLTGSFPGQDPGRFEVSAFGIRLPDVYALLQRDTSGVAGRVAFDARGEGTRAAPLFRGSGTVTGAVIGEFQAPLVRGVFNYADQRLESNLTFWRTGRQVLNVDVALPLELALTDVERRQLPGPLSIRADADSVDLAVVEAFSPNLRNVRGSVRIDAMVEGTWDRPRLGGFVSFQNGSAGVPGLGVRYHGIEGTVRLAGDSLIAERLVMRSGDGRLTAAGGIRLERLTHPVLGLRMLAEDFLVADIRDYLTLRARGEVQLVGPIERPVLTGGATASNSVLYFSDLITKNIVNLEDPMMADLVDTTALRAQNLRARFQSRFLDSLQIRDLQFRAGEGVWLRSSEANLQLEGRVTVNKERWSPRAREYRVSGELTTPRGTYTLNVPVGRTFLVERGTLRYFNTPDLDAELDVEARHVVRTVDSGEEYPIIAHITGTLLAPKLALTTGPGRPPLPEADLVALLLTGATRASLLSGTQDFALDQVGIAMGSTLLSAELRRTLMSGTGLELDLVEIRPGTFTQNGSLVAGTGTVTTLALGRQLMDRLFAVIRAGACLGTLDFSYQYLGLSLEYRLHPTLKFQLAAEPVQSCLTQTARAFGTRSPYQFATDLRWDREY